ncbi:hypothetical protein KSP39_PZI014068 [Platanthera zijinensis]|uniref:H(+)-transporting two-sector ATPase n=1 Tax=Platanthera zijinensis TaxID=2320716 RepID=A0AAP0G465_9ASPA
MEMKESGVINEKNIAESKVALVYGQMNEPPGARMRVGLTALTMAEYFRDVNEQDELQLVLKQGSNELPYVRALADHGTKTERLTSSSEPGFGV